MFQDIPFNFTKKVPEIHNHFCHAKKKGWKYTSRCWLRFLYIFNTGNKKTGKCYCNFIVNSVCGEFILGLVFSSRYQNPIIQNIAIYKQKSLLEKSGD